MHGELNMRLLVLDVLYNHSFLRSKLVIKCYHGLVSFWTCELVGLWACGLVGLWACGLVGLWAFGLVGLWANGQMGLWANGLVAGLAGL